MKKENPENFVSIAGKLASSQILAHISNSMGLVSSIIIVGSFFVLLQNFPISGYKTLMSSLFGAFWYLPIQKISDTIFNNISLFIVFSASYTYIQNKKKKGIGAGILATIVFMIIDTDAIFSGSQGIISALIIGSLIGYLYFTISSYLSLHGKLPDGIPPAVINSYIVILPFLIISGGTILIDLFCPTLLSLMHQYIQLPLQYVFGSLPGMIIFSLVITIMWWNGVHGGSIIPAFFPVLLANALTNQQILNGELSQTPYFVTSQFIDQFVTVTGSGFTMGAIIAVFLTAKSEEEKEVFKLSWIPGFFNINEPVLYGLPIIQNKYMFIPFIMAPIVSAAIAYYFIHIGFLQIFGAVFVVWTTPIFLSGFLVGGFKGVLVQGLCLLSTVLIYTPFIILNKNKIK